MTDLARGSNGERMPEPGLETAIFAGRRGDLEMVDVARIFAGWPILIASHVDPFTTEGGPQPQILTSPAGVPVVAVFTSPDQVGAYADGMHMMNLAGGMIAAGARGGAGIVVNPGSTPSMEFAPEAMPIIAGFPRQVSATGYGGRDLTPYEVAAAELAAWTSPSAAAIEALRTTVLTFPSTNPESQFSRTVNPHGDLLYVAAATHDDLLRADQTGVIAATRTALIADAGDLIPEGYGLLLNPGTAFSMRVEPHVVDTLR